MTKPPWHSPSDGANPQRVSFDGYDGADELRRESVLGLGNGLLFVRSSAPEQRLARVSGGAESNGHYGHYPGLYRAGLYNSLPSEIDGESVRETSLPRLPDASVLAVRRAEGTWLGTDTAEVLHYRQVLDMRNARVLRTLVLRVDDATTRIDEFRFTSFARPSIFVVMWRVTACDWSGELEIADGIDGAVCNGINERERRFGGRHLEDLSHHLGPDDILLLTAQLTSANVRLALGTRTQIQCQGRDKPYAARSWEDGEACFRSSRVQVDEGGTVNITKTVTIHTSRDPLVLDATEAAQAELCRAGSGEAMYQTHRRAWMRAWRSARVICADKSLSRALNWRAFHVAQTVTAHSTLEDLGVPARGWQEGYDGHIFWDDLFVLPAAGRTQPDHALGPLMYRYRRLDPARQAARAAGYEGAMYPWRSAATGEEETPKYQFNPLDGRWRRDDTHLERHVGASVAWNAWGYYRASGDQEFLRAHGAEMIVEIARFWASIARFDETRGRYLIRGVIGPDEYHNAYPQGTSPGLDNNAYTNVMAMWTLLTACDALGRLSKADYAGLACRIGLRKDEPRRWAEVAGLLFVPFVANGVIEQFEGFDSLRRHENPTRATPPDQRTDWVFERNGDTVDAWQIVKQPDVLMLFYVLGQRRVASLLANAGYKFDAAAARRTIDYYLARITHESTLSKVACAGAIAPSDRELSLRYFEAALKTDVMPGASSAKEGVHLGAMAGILDVLVRQYAGIEFEDDAILFRPCWPSELPRVRMSLRFRQQLLRLYAEPGLATLYADKDNRMTVKICTGRTDTWLEPGESVSSTGQ